ncbi:hypothetical protein CEXT_343271 [Caerostris extrusa]|uniref:Uncharacterized protein n=1 Tax=Caerostris extrusa TaxID=172846 RepID=A0AAV4VHF2_CAEEX|nr:hypothetical protein CEXT_343271 [Caerostris extrusa]
MTLLFRIQAEHVISRMRIKLTCHSERVPSYAISWKALQIHSLTVFIKSMTVLLVTRVGSLSNSERERLHFRNVPFNVIKDHAWKKIKGHVGIVDRTALLLLLSL